MMRNCPLIPWTTQPALHFLTYSWSLKGKKCSRTEKYILCKDLEPPLPWTVQDLGEHQLRPPSYLFVTQRKCGFCTQWNCISRKWMDFQRLLVAYTRNPSTQDSESGVLQVQGHPQLQGQFKATLGYLRPWPKQNKNNWKESNTVVSSIPDEAGWSCAKWASQD